MALTEQIRRAAIRAGLMGINGTSVAAHKLEAFADYLVKDERERVAALLKGIDECDSDTDDGWWETSTGAAFGAGVLERVRSGE